MSQDHPPSLLATLTFLDIFGLPLELTKREQLELAPHFQCRSREVMERDGALSFHEEEAFWEKWRARRQHQAQLLKKARRWSWIFVLCPFVRLSAVCNSVAMGDVEEDSDIDLFIITKPKRLFLARLCLTILTSLFGIRRHGQKIQGRFCLSFYITEETLNLGAIALKPQDIYLAFWLRTLTPLAGTYASYEAFIKANQSWLSQYFSKPFFLQKQLFTSSCWLHKGIELLLDWDFLERLAKQLQWPRMQRKYRTLKDTSGTVLSDQMLKFHDEDKRGGIQKRWNC